MIERSTHEEGGTNMETKTEFEFGFRYVSEVNADGKTTLREVPLTLEDLLYPQEGDRTVESHAHQVDRRYAAQVFETRCWLPPETFVSSDLLIDWGIPGINNTAADVAVFSGLLERPAHQTRTLRLTQSRERCRLVLEIVSPNSRANDVERKMILYHNVGIPMYAILDQQTEDGPRYLHGYRWTENEYEEMELTEEGRLRVDFLELDLAVINERLVCFDIESGEELGDYAQAREEVLQLRENVENLVEEVELLVVTQHSLNENLRRAEDNAKILSQEKQTLTQEKQTLTQEKQTLTQEKQTLTQNLRKAEDAAREAAREAEDQMRKLKQEAEESLRKAKEAHENELQQLREQLLKLQKGA
jgi:hypothetical protein